MAPVFDFLEGEPVWVGVEVVVEAVEEPVEEEEVVLGEDVDDGTVA
jgi:hypothetical protein